MPKHYILDGYEPLYVSCENLQYRFFYGWNFSDFFFKITKNRKIKLFATFLLWLRIVPCQSKLRHSNHQELLRIFRPHKYCHLWHDSNFLPVGAIFYDKPNFGKTYGKKFESNLCIFRHNNMQMSKHVFLKLMIRHIRHRHEVLGDVQANEDVALNWSQ